MRYDCLAFSLQNATSEPKARNMQSEAKATMSAVYSGRETRCPNVLGSFVVMNMYGVLGVKGSKSVISTANGNGSDLRCRCRVVDFDASRSCVSLLLILESE